MPLGFRYEYATTRIARLQLAQAYQVLKEQERRAQTALAKQYQPGAQYYQLIEIRHMAREALAEQLQTRSKQFAAGTKGATIEFLLDAQNQWANALSQEFQAVVDYNVALASFEFARGTILAAQHVVIAEGPLPGCAQVRAVEHEEDRTRAVVLAQQGQPIIYPPLEPGQPDPAPLPNLPPNQAPALPALLLAAPPVPPRIDALDPPAIARVRPATIPPAAATPFSQPVGEPTFSPLVEPIPRARLGIPCARALRFRAASVREWPREHEEETSPGLGA